MNDTPKHQRKVCLSLRRGKDNRKSFHQACYRSVQSGFSSNVSLESQGTEIACSPTVSAIDDIEFTPPHKKRNLNHSIDYSPKVLDASFSPSGLLSQSIAIDSPEVGWKWGHGNKESHQDLYCVNSRKLHTAQNRKPQQVNFVVNRDGRRKNSEQEMRKAEIKQTDDLLKKRCAKLKKNLKDVTEDIPKVSSISCEISTETTSKLHKKQNVLNDFLNDSDSDCLLLAVTQQVECKIVGLTAPMTTRNQSSLPDYTPNSALNKKEKRSSLYMKFLEDDSPDDWFVSLDEEIRKATQDKKQRTSFQRYKSMPSNSFSEANHDEFLTKKILEHVENASTFDCDKRTIEPETCKIKRRASTHALNNFALKDEKRIFP